MATSHLAAVLILQGSLREAEKLCGRAIREQLERHGVPPPTLCMVHLCLAWVLEAFGILAPKAAISPISQPLVELLSARELEVLRLVAQGLSNREIGEQGLSSGI